MASPQVNQRWPSSVVERAKAAADRLGMSLTDFTLDAVLAKLEAEESDREPERRPKAPSKVRAPVPADPRSALKQAESRVGVEPARIKARLDTSMVPVHDGGKRPAYQKGQTSKGSR